ncbi:MAG: homoserine dehydrogenase [Nitrososphaerales archaeon]
MRILLIGFGVVGQSFAKLILERRNELVKVHGLNPRIVGVVDKGGAAVANPELDLAEVLEVKKREDTVAASKHGKKDASALDLISNLDLDVVVETTPTNIKTAQPGLSHIEYALKLKRNVITTNKGPLALALPELIELSRYNNVALLFSGTVGGGTPILDFGKRCLASDKLVMVEGILNGTTNYILSSMEAEGKSFEEALKEAQKLGYAEADPTLDVEGWDTACKTVIIANWLMGRGVTLKDLSVEGITHVTKSDIEEAKKKGKSIKLVGRVAERIDVKPRLINRNDPICISGTLNAVRFVSQYAGDEIIIGKGAGGMETASAILRDLLEVKYRMAQRWYE